MKYFFFFYLLFFSSQLLAQDTTSDKKHLHISAYAEIYYSYDFNKPANNSKPSFIYNFSRNNEVNLNIGYIKAAYQDEKMRANISIAAGTYTNAAYVNEPGVLKNIYEANAGIKISSKSNMWIDAGIFSSHIGFESAIGSTCWNLTRSMVAENTPYYESGVKFGYTSTNNKWLFSALFLNGWQHISRPNNNTTPAFGTQITYTPSSNITINYSTFIGNDKPDSAKQMRYYNNVYGIFQLNKFFGITAGFDYGLQQKEKGSSSFNTLFAPILLLKISPGNKNNVGARIEYYSDPHNIIVSRSTPNGFKIFGWSINYDRQITSKATCRFEVRNMNGKDNYFLKNDNSFTNKTVFVTGSVAVNF